MNEKAEGQMCTCRFTAEEMRRINLLKKKFGENRSAIIKRAINELFMWDQIDYILSCANIDKVTLCSNYTKDRSPTGKSAQKTVKEALISYLNEEGRGS